jgi:hypothetical protein
MFTRRKISPEWQAITSAQAAQVNEARRKEEGYRELMLEAMRGLGFEACCETFAGHILGRPDATAEQKHDAIQRMAREAWRDIEPR